MEALHHTEQQFLDGVTSTNFSFLNLGEFFEIYVPLVKSFLNFVEVNSVT